MRYMDCTERLLRASGIAAFLLLAACDRPAEVATVEPANPALPPALVEPSETADAAAPPSYEVGIATAAAGHNRAKEKCAEMSERLRAICDAEADAAFATAQENLEDLRGNQQ